MSTWRERVFWSVGDQDDQAVNYEDVILSYRESWTLLVEIEDRIVVFMDPVTRYENKPLVVVFYRGELGDDVTR